MDNSVFFSSDNENTYLYDQSQKMFIYVNPIFEKFYQLDKKNIDVKKWEDETTKLIDNKAEYYYQLNKYLFLKTHGFFTQRICNDIAYNTSEYRIYDNLSQIEQIVFEVTDRCNLNCYYCAYGELYSNHDIRHKKLMKKEEAIALIDYFVDIWRKSNLSNGRDVAITFYGGEPLLNFDLIECLVKYISKVFPKQIQVTYSMTTNAMLLEKHIDFLIKYKFKILVSLDGDKFSNSYRKQFNGEDSYERIIAQLMRIKDKHPIYFENNISFNSVLHNRNSVESINAYFKNKFNKRSSIAEINENGINPEMKDAFSKVFKEKEDVIDSLRIPYLLRNSWSTKVLNFIRQFTNNYYTEISDLYVNKGKSSYPCSGTCSPFGKKIFLTVNGKILPCEKIGHNYPLGYLINNKVDLNIKSISSFYNSAYDILSHQCRECYMINLCDNCLFNMRNPEKPICERFATKENLKKYLCSIFSLFEDKRNIYDIILTNFISV